MNPVEVREGMEKVERKETVEERRRGRCGCGGQEEQKLKQEEQKLKKLKRKDEL